ncbi:protein fem-1 homolog A-A-like [Macrobrachium rosenbergii]|uniref:protein fem-1 homolog A-A-like n=1 Tax=Macrobrachium rosenbergii TaxID=79674 RepID=UPI0034D660AE
MSSASSLSRPVLIVAVIARCHWMTGLFQASIQPGLTNCQWHAVKKAVYKLVKLDPRDYLGSTLLHMACSRKFKDVEDSILAGSVTPRTEVVDLLLENGADPSVTDHDGNTPLHEIAKNKDCPKGVVDALLSGGAHFDSANGQGQTSASLRASRGQPVSQLVNVVRHTSLQCLAAACIRRHGISYMRILPARLAQHVNGALIYPKAEDGLSYPSYEELSEVITLQQLENIEIEDDDAVQERAEQEALLTGSDPSVTDHEGSTPLHEIAKNEECPKGVVDALLSEGAHLDAVNSQGQTFAS